MRWPARIGRWEVRGALGVGAVAEVLLGVDEHGQEVALKRVLAERAHESLHDEALRAEGRLLARIAHSHVVGYVGWVEEAPPTLVLERLRGRTLAAELEAGPMQPERALLLCGQAAAALAAVHAATDEAGAPLRAVHRDVSPENLFVCDPAPEAGALKLFDFNVAAVVGRTEAPAPGSLQGRVAYMAPEQARCEAVDDRADVFALGVVLWELLARQRLFWRGNTLATLRAVCDEPIPRARARCPQLPEPIDELLATLLDRDPKRRPSAAALAAALAAARAALR